MTFLRDLCICIGIALLVFLALRVDAATSHPLPKGTNVKIGLHKICKTLTICRDPVSRPRINCGWNNRGQIEREYDSKLGVIVTWECRCPWGQYGDCSWFRLDVRHASAFELDGYVLRSVREWMRRCAPIVCLKRMVFHNYRTLRYYPNRRLA